MNKEHIAMAKAYKDLFELTGHPLFFTLQKQAEKGNIVTLENSLEQTDDLSI